MLCDGWRARGCPHLALGLMAWPGLMRATRGLAQFVSSRAPSDAVAGLSALMQRPSSHRDQAHTRRSVRQARPAKIRHLS